MANDIDKHGLLQPVIVTPEENKYKLIAGFRRYSACTSLGWSHIPCVVREGMSEVDARTLNLSENIQRRNLTIAQEARAIQRLKELGATQQLVADKLGMSRTWVQVRYMLLDLPQEAIDAADANILNTTQIRELHYMYASNGRDKEAIEKEIHRIKVAKERGARSVAVGKKYNPNAKRMRTKPEVLKMLDHIYSSFGASLTTRALAWCGGEITDGDLVDDLEMHAIDMGVDYTPPTHGEE